MILSASRRTDIPCCYADWFINRINAGFLYVRNPVNPRQISKILLSPDKVDCIVFWTKNPQPMLDKLKFLKDYSYYFQFTLTPYGKDIEPNIPHKKREMIPIFQKLSSAVGKERVVWRYDPVFITPKYTKGYHIEAFAQMAEALRGYTDKVVFSFLDRYRKIKKEIERLEVIEMKDYLKRSMACEIAEIARRNHMKAASCSETIDFSDLGIEMSSCIDQKLIEEIIGYPIDARKDSGQRKNCMCIESTETGAYGTCTNGCKYCYANDFTREKNHSTWYDAESPLLCGCVTEADQVTEKKASSLERLQMDIADL